MIASADPHDLFTELPDTFCIFILTHGRPDNIRTLKTLDKIGYRGRLYFIIDNEDKTAPRYYEKYGDKVIMFDKKAMADKVDEGNNFDERRTITHARNACFEIAPTIGVTHFMQLDDDYTSVWYRIIHKGVKREVSIKDFNRTLLYLLEYYNSIPALSIAMAQGGDLIGGIGNEADRRLRIKKRKAMNSFLCSTERPFQWVGSMNEDVNTYTTLGSRGALFFTLPDIALTQRPTQTQKGGISEMYKRFGTYCKAFTTVMMCPASVEVYQTETTFQRLHHRIHWSNTVPCIIPERYRKSDKSSQTEVSE